MRRLVLSAAVMLMTAGFGCQAHKEKGDDSRMVKVQGYGRLLSVNQVLGAGTLEIDGKTVNFWWENRVERPAMAPRGTDQDRAAMVAAPDASRYTIPFKAQVGDVIYFQGLTSRGDIFLTGAIVKKK
jgi:hypothetical protein